MSLPDFWLPSTVWTRSLEDTVAKMRAEIAQERADRETTEETLLKLLEVPMGFSGEAKENVVVFVGVEEFL